MIKLFSKLCFVILMFLPLLATATDTDFDGFFDRALLGQIGADIDGEAAGDSSGHSVALSADGTVATIGAAFDGTDKSLDLQSVTAIAHTFITSSASTNSPAICLSSNSALSA